MEKQIRIEIDVEGLEGAAEKAKELLVLLKECQQIIHLLSPEPKD